MASEVVNKYIERRYDRWLDYSNYYSSLAGIDDEALDILNEVLCCLLQKDEVIINRLFEKKQGIYTELDFYILKMIRLNITSPTSPYQHKYKPIPVDENANIARLDIIDEMEEEVDSAEEILKKYNQVREVFKSLNLSPKAKKIFSWKFFEDESFSDWPGKDEKRVLYSTYNKVLELIRDKIKGYALF